MLDTLPINTCINNSCFKGKFSELFLIQTPFFHAAKTIRMPLNLTIQKYFEKYLYISLVRYITFNMISSQCWIHMYIINTRKEACFICVSISWLCILHNACIYEYVMAILRHLLSNKFAYQFLVFHILSFNIFRPNESITIDIPYY